MQEYWLASKKFRQITRGKQCTANTVCSGGGELLIFTGDTVKQWKGYFKDLLNPADAPSEGKTEAEDSDIGSSIIWAEVTAITNKLLSSKAPEVDEISPVHLKSLNV